MGWRKWDELFMRFMNPVATQMVEAVKWRDDFKVLDLAAGTGEPGLSAALQVPRGKVIATDVAEEMLIVAQDKARLRTLSNFETRVCGVEALPFEDGAFDVALCRFGLMFFPNIGAAAREILRVLAPDGT